MSLGRRKVRLDDPSAWVFNRMADVYAARPAYPAAMIDALAALAGVAGARIADVGAGIGHLALPLAERGFGVVAVEPASAMLECLRHAARRLGLDLRAEHASAEVLPIASASMDLVVVADAFHFLDAALTADEIDRVLTPAGALAVVTCQFGDTPFMRAIVRAMEDSVPRRPRPLARSVVQLSAVTRVPLVSEWRFHDETPVDHATLERILRSISFIGPAMNVQRFAAFRERVNAISARPVWARTFSLRAGRRAPSHRAALRARRAETRSPPAT
jgi:ubiquinone/menaquinone biosynthesis C-methylase UbiE